MEAVLRRCLDCDCTFRVTSQCPRCESTNTLIIAEEVRAEVETPMLGAILILCHAIVVTLATQQSPGMFLGTFLFFNGLCAVLLFVGVERIPRVLRISAALSAVAQVAIMAITGQALLFAPAIVMVIAGILMLYHDSSVAWLKSALLVGIASGLLIAVLSAVARWGVVVPGWWQGAYLFKDHELQLPKGVAEPKRDLPTHGQP